MTDTPTDPTTPISQIPIGTPGCPGYTGRTPEPCMVCGSPFEQHTRLRRTSVMVPVEDRLESMTRERDDYRRWLTETQTLLGYACALATNQLDRIGEVVQHLGHRHPEDQRLVVVQDPNDPKVWNVATFGPDSDVATLFHRLEQLLDDDEIVDDTIVVTPDALATVTADIAGDYPNPDDITRAVAEIDLSNRWGVRAGRVVSDSIVIERPHKLDDEIPVTMTHEDALVLAAWLISTVAATTLGLVPLTPRILAEVDLLRRIGAGLPDDPNDPEPSPEKETDDVDPS